MSHTDGFIDAGGCRLHFQSDGETTSPAWVMVHAGVADLAQWDPQVAAFSDSYRTVRYDTRGWGKSITEDVPFSNRRDLLQLLDYLQIEKAIVMGCSRGGQIALDFTLEFPDRVRGLIWVCGGVSGYDGSEPLPEEAQLFQEMTEAEEAKDFPRLSALEVRVWAVGPLRDPATVDPALKEWMYTTCMRNYTTHTSYGQPQVLTPPAVNRLNEVQVPTLVVIGEHDESPTRDSAKYLADHVSGATYHLIKDMAHIPNRERPEEFNETVRSFFKHSNL